MQPLDFLAAVLPSSGIYCVAELPRKVHSFTSSIDEVVSHAARIDAGAGNAYFALASFKESGTRAAANAVAMRALFVDLDCGTADSGGPKAFADKQAAVEALEAFTESTGLAALGKPWVIDSGGGIHAYWPFDNDAAINEWRPVAEALKREARARSFPIDMTCTADAARVLRVPGTHNKKYDPPQPRSERTMRCTPADRATSACLEEAKQMLESTEPPRR